MTTDRVEKVGRRLTYTRWDEAHLCPAGRPRLLRDLKGGAVLLGVGLARNGGRRGETHIRVLLREGFLSDYVILRPRLEIFI